MTRLATAVGLDHIQSYDFTLGPAGNRTKIVEHAGQSNERTVDYGCDDLYRLTGETVANAAGLVYQKVFTYDNVGNRLSQTTVIARAAQRPEAISLTPGTIGYTYDDRDRLLLEGPQPYGWDANGNLTSKDAEAAYTWDSENRLIRAQIANGTVVEHVYDADGNRVQTRTTPNGQPTTAVNYLVDTSGGLSHVVAETDASGNLLAYYVRGDDLLSVMRPVGGAWQTRYYHADGIGSVRALTDESGAITDTYTHTAFGEMVEHVGTDPQPYAFTGEPLDPNAGFQYHRARWMDPRVGRFVGMDPWRGTSLEPVSLHRYLYASLEPTNNTDPSGEVETVQGLATAGYIHMRIQSIALVAAMTATTLIVLDLIDATSGEPMPGFGEGSWAVQSAVVLAELAVASMYRSVADLITKAKDTLRRQQRRLSRLLPKVIPMPEAIIPAVARHVAEAQMQGKPALLERTTPELAKLNRRRALMAHGRVANMSLDEYPFASSVQGGWGASLNYS